MLAEQADDEQPEDGFEDLFDNGSDLEDEDLPYLEE